MHLTGSDRESIAAVLDVLDANGRRDNDAPLAMYWRGVAREVRRFRDCVDVESAPVPLAVARAGVGS